jgi:bacterioferritin-associated ferredoxin
MYVCVCLAVTQAEVEAAIQGGATTRREVTRACGAGGDCGACHGMIESMIEDHLEANEANGGSLGEGPRITECPAAPKPQERLVPGHALVRTRAA